MSSSERPLPTAPPSLDLDADGMRAATEAVVRWTIDHVASLAQQPSWDHDRARERADALREALPEDGAPIEELLDVVGRAVAVGYNTAGPGYLAYVPGGGIYPAALFDYLALAVNRYVGVWAAAPAFVQLEVDAVDWLRAFVGLPPEWSGILTTGGSLSNWIGLVAARTERLGDDFQRGVIYTSRECHHSVHKAAVLAGFRRDRVRGLATDDRRRLSPDALAAAIAEDRACGLVPAILVASHGTTNTGAIDPLPELAGVAREAGLWIHVDAAYGGFFRGTPEGHERLPGLELGDSVTLDPHKGLFLPYGTGCLLVRSRDLLERAFGSDADYLQDLERPADAANYADLSPELSRDFRGLRVWSSLKLFGARAFRQNLSEKLALARWAAAELAAEPALEVLEEPQLSVAAFRLRDGDDAGNRELFERILAGRRVFLSSTTLDGRFTLRLCVLSFRTHGPEVECALSEVRRALGEMGLAGGERA